MSAPVVVGSILLAKIVATVISAVVGYVWNKWWAIGDSVISMVLLTLISVVVAIVRLALK